MIKDALMVSFKVTFTATLISFTVGTFLARILTRHKYKYMGLAEMIIMMPLFLPPSVVGYLLLISLGRDTLIGGILKKLFDINIIFTWEAAAIAAFIVSIPMMYQSAKTAFLSIDPVYEDVARSMGAGRWQIFRYVTAPLAIKSILSGVLLSFGRAFGEFGATLMVAGNIQGKTQTVTVALYYAVENGEFKTADTLLVIVLIISCTMIFILNYVLKGRVTY